MKRKYNRIGVFFSILLLAVVLGAAFYLPGIISRIYDNRTLEKVNTRKLELSTYQVSYRSFEEKLHAIGMALADGCEFNIVNRKADVVIPDEGEVSLQTIKQEAERLFQEELQLNLDLSAYVPTDRRAVSVLCSSASGEEMLTENHIYILTYMCTEISVDKEMDYPKLYDVIPHITLWVDKEFGKIYGFAASGIPMEGLGMNLTIWENSHVDAITNYWGLGEEFALGETEQVIYDNWQQDSMGTVWGEENIHIGQDAYIPMNREVSWNKVNVSLRLGLQPFIYNIYEMGYTISDVN